MKRIHFAILLASALPPGAGWAAEGDAAIGKALFQRQCAACHQIATSRNGAGPTLQGVMGRTAGSVEDFNYSAALKSWGQAWTAEALDSYLANPVAAVKGTRMTLRVTKEQDRKDLIAYLTAL